MRPELALCAHLAAAAPGPAPFTLLPAEILEWDGAPLEAVVRCRSCDACAWLRRVEQDAARGLATVALAPLRAADVALYFRNRARGSCDAARARAELDALAAATGPFERRLTLRVDSLEIVDAAAPHQPWHPAGEPRSA